MEEIINEKEISDSCSTLVRLTAFIWNYQNFSFAGLVNFSFLRLQITVTSLLALLSVIRALQEKSTSPE